MQCIYAYCVFILCVRMEYICILCVYIVCCVFVVYLYTQTVFKIHMIVYKSVYTCV